MLARLATLPLLLGAFLACSTFPVIEANECGNRVLERGEDCDTYVAQALLGASCRPKGVIGECHFDCSRKNDGTRYVCPDSMRCTPEGICRAVTDGFDLPEKLSSDISASLSAPDFDGDGHHELLSTEFPDQGQQARFTLHYFNADTELEDARRFPRSTTRPVTRDVTGEGLDDLVISNGRIGMLPGRPDRDWVPATFSSYVLEGPQLRIVPVSSAFVSDTFALVALATLNGRPGLYLPSGVGGLKLRLELGRSLDELVAPIAADIVEGEDSPCNELVLAFRGDSSYRIIDLCEITAKSRAWNLEWRAEPRQQTVQLPPGQTIQGPPVAGDVDGDGHLDILISNGVQSYLAHGTGHGLEPEAAPFIVVVLGQEASGADPLGTLLAAGDVTGDGYADFVTPTRLIGSRTALSDGSVAYLDASVNSGQPWTMAEIVDLNGNDRLDVVAAAEGWPGVTFLSGSKDSFQIESLISTSGPVRQLASGDFDGDFIKDVALVQGGRPNQPQDTLAIAFGTRDRAPLPPVRLAELTGIQQLGSQHDGALDDVFMSSTTRSGGVTRSTFTLFEGSADRLPLAPYTLNTFSQDGSLQDWDAPALIVGGFTEPGGSDVVAIGRRQRLEDGWSQWLIPSIGNSTLPPRLLDNPSTLAPGIFPATLERHVGRVSVAGAAADLEGDGFDEALWLMPNNDGPSCALLIYDIDGDAERATLTTELDLGGICVAPELAAVDLDGIRGVDLLLLMGDPHDRGRRIEMLWNDGEGHFSVGERTYLEIEGEDIRAFTMMPPPGIQLALVTDRGLYFASPRGVERKFEIVGKRTDFDDAQALVATDLNGDKLTEVVVADANGHWLMKAKLK